MKNALFITAFSLLLAPLAAHGPGCACHQTPGSLVPPNGGILEHTENHLWVELVDEADPMEIHVYESNLDPIKAREHEVKARVVLPKRVKAKADINLERRGDYYLAYLTIDGYTYRYRIDVELSHDGYTDHVSFDLEL